MYELKNKYLLMRHAESVANREGVIISAPETGSKDYGLTNKGVQSVAEVALNSRLDSTVLIYCSDFLRTYQTASIMSDVLDADQPIFTEQLRERYFGSWEGTNTDNYALVWQDDLQNLFQNEVESVYSVLKRVLSFVWQLESQHQGKTILLVSHGDSLQIILSWCRGMDANMHRSMNPMKPANMRQLVNVRSLTEIESIIEDYELEAA